MMGKMYDGFRGFSVPAQILERYDLTIYDKMVYIVLRSFTSAQRPTAWPSYSTIARLAGMTDRQARKCVANLIKKGMIVKKIRNRVSKNGRISCDSNEYTILGPEEWPPVEYDSGGVGNHIPRGTEYDSGGVRNDIPKGTEYDSGGVRNDIPKGTEYDSYEHLNRNHPKVEDYQQEIPPIEHHQQEQATGDDDLGKISIGVQATKKTIQRWLEQTNGDRERIEAAKAEAVLRKARNPIGYVTTLLSDPGWEPHRNDIASVTQGTKEPQKPNGQAQANREKYAAFYALMEAAATRETTTQDGVDPES